MKFIKEWILMTLAVTAALLSAAGLGFAFVSLPVWFQFLCLFLAITAYMTATYPRKQP